MICDHVNNLNQYSKVLSIIEESVVAKEQFRRLQVEDSILVNMIDKTKNQKKPYQGFIRTLTFNMLLSNYQLEEDSKIIYAVDQIKGNHKLEEHKIYQELYEKYSILFKDIKYFPVPLDLSNHEYISYENTWKMPRTYGGNRSHEGCDLMTSNNVSGYFPIISVSDGTVEQKGWLEQGGYRIGIRSESGVYFYYAHLDSYHSLLSVGDVVKAGSLLGYMGNTGYSKVEGTSGNFDVHLHFGIYIDEEGKEMSINPYWILKYLENYKLGFHKES